MTCTRCGAPYLAADPECPRCGLPLVPSIVGVTAGDSGPEPGKASTPGQPPVDPGRPVVALAGIAIVCVIGVLLALNRPGSDDGGAPIGTRPPSGAIADTPTQASRTNQASPVAPLYPPPYQGPTGVNLAAGASVRAEPPRGDDKSHPVDYGTANLTDGDLNTAWRVHGAYAGSITITLPERSSIQVLGLTNGNTTGTGNSGVDRYLEDRRIQFVTWTFDDRTSITQELEPDVRTIQHIKIDPVETKTVTLSIGRSTNPGSINSFTAITEIFLGAGAE
jgi:hypothetical protein